MKAPDLDAEWADWLVYADWLSEQGDERGELLVLESRRPREVDDRIAAWLDREGWEEDDDVFLERYADIARRLPGLGPAVPAAFAARFAELLSYPISRLLVFLNIAADVPEPPRSVVLVQLEKDLYQTLIDWIDDAFDGVPVPDEDHLTIYQAEAADNYNTCDRSRDHLGRWQDLPEQHLLDNEWSLSYLDEQGIPYYLPAVMCFELRYGFRAPGGWITESLGYQITPEALMERFGTLTKDQRAAVCAYALFSENTAAFAAWIRVVEAEKDGPREDWLAILCAP